MAAYCHCDAKKQEIDLQRKNIGISPAGIEAFHRLQMGPPCTIPGFLA